MSHLTAERIDLFDQMTFAYPADRGITGHLTNVIKIQGQHQRLTPHTSCCERRLYTRMAGTNYYYIVDIDI